MKQEQSFVVGAWRILLAKRPAWDNDRMRRIAEANDNGGIYYRAQSGRSVADLERLFRQREVAILLEENVGAILGGPGVTQPGEVIVQLRREAVKDKRVFDFINLCFSELRVDLIGPVQETKETE